jgi:hypothetical protein
LPLAGLAMRESDDVLRGPHEFVGTRDLRHLSGGMLGEHACGLGRYVLLRTARCHSRRTGGPACRCM